MLPTCCFVVTQCDSQYYDPLLLLVSYSSLSPSSLSPSSLAFSDPFPLLPFLCFSSPSPARLSPHLPSHLPVWQHVGSCWQQTGRRVNGIVFVGRRTRLVLLRSVHISRLPRLAPRAPAAQPAQRPPRSRPTPVTTAAACQCTSRRRRSQERTSCSSSSITLTASERCARGRAWAACERRAWC